MFDSYRCSSINLIPRTLCVRIYFCFRKDVDEVDYGLCCSSSSSVSTIGNHWSRPYWRFAQWCTTGLLWWTWLSHDMANIAVFLPREVPVDMMLVISVIFVAGLGWMFRERGGKIQKIVIEKTSTKYIRSACLIDLAYFVVLYFFKELNNIPMSTTWVFVGLLTGRELAIATVHNTKMKQVFPLVTKDFMKMMIGLGVSVGIVLMIHYVIIPNGY